MTPISLTPVTKHNKSKQKILPLLAVLNSRIFLIRPLLTELGIESKIGSESWEREDNPLDNFTAECCTQPPIYIIFSFFLHDTVRRLK